MDGDESINVLDAVRKLAIDPYFIQLQSTWATICDVPSSASFYYTAKPELVPTYLVSHVIINIVIALSGRPRGRGS